tara:strand:- start:6777 stop:8828 length:2052 start_codon:yes stop_codon:yes gene_type:complete
MALVESKLSNAYETTLAAALLADSTDTTISVAVAPTDSGNTAISPSTATPMYLIIDPDSDTLREYIRVTAISGTTLTAVRNIDSGGGGLKAHSIGAKVRQAPVAQMFDDVHDRINTLINTAGTAVNTSDGLVKDQDDMSSNSASHLATQQSIKAYVDATIQTEETIEDFVGGMFSSNTETFITATYDDSDGTLDLVVPVLDEDNMSSDSASHLATQQSIKAYVDDVAQTTEEVQDIVGAMFSSNTETNISVTYDDSDGTIDLVADLLTEEAVEDYVGGMVTGNTETFITVTYEDSDGTLDFVVPVLDEDNMASDSATHLATQQSIKAYVDGLVQTEESIEDFVGGMVTGNTETFITVTYEDSDGTMDFVVPVKDEDDMSSDSATHLATQQSIKAYVDTVAQTTEEVQDIVGAMFSSNTETRISATYDDSDGTIDLVVDDMTADTQLTTEAVQDIVGAMFSSNTETRIAVTYDDSDGTIDLVVDDMTTNTQLTQEQVEDYVGGMLDGDETFITVAYDDTDGNIDFTVPVLDEDDFSSDSASHLATQQSIKAYVDGIGVSTEQVQDIVGAMFSSNTETNITATYQDADGTIDLVVAAVDSTAIVDGDSDFTIADGTANGIHYELDNTDMANWNAGGIALTTAGGIFRHHQTQAATYTVAANEGAVLAGPITITGTVTNSGTMVVI